MNDRLYKQAMDRLPISDDLEARTLAMLKASSEDPLKEEAPMTQEKKTRETQQAQETQTPNTPRRKPISRSKVFAIGSGALAAAACLVLVLVPLLQRPSASYETQQVAVDVNIVPQPAPPAEPGTPVQNVAKPLATGMPQAVQAQAPLGYAADAEMDMMAEAQMAPMAAFDSYAAPAAFPDWNTEEYSVFTENRFLSTRTSPLSTFAADVDTASYAKLRATILEGGCVVPDSVRIEEMLNYFTYSYAKPKEGQPFGVTTELSACPWNPDSKLLLVGLQAKEVQQDNIPAQNLVFLIDVSGSMDEPNKLPLVKRSFQLLLEALRPQDTVSIVTYAGSDTVVLDGVRAADKTRIMAALDEMSAGGGTAGAAGIQTAYQLAEKHFLQGGNNRIILATDGDLNIGVSDEGSLTRMVEEKRKTGVFLSVLGFGMGNYKDNKLEALADNGNGNYAYIDSIFEARKALVEQIGGTFLTVAKDVKLQVEFNPAKVKGYRLIGYENRTMAAEDFSNDQKDGGEVGSGHRVTVLYEVVPADSPMKIDAVDTKYQTAVTGDSKEWLTLSIRCKKPDGDVSDLYTYPVEDSALAPTMSDNLRFASAVAEVGMLLRGSEFKGSASYEDALNRLRGTASVSGDVYKEEFQYMVSLLARQTQIPTATPEPVVP